MISFLVRRLGASVLLLWLVLSAVFFIAHATPGDPSKLFEDSRLTAAQAANLRRIYGLDRPLIEQYALWLKAAVHGDWGISMVQNRPVAEILGEAVLPTFALATSALAIQLGVGFLFGVAGALRRERPLDHVLRVLSLIFFSLPVFWLSLMAILLFAVHWPLFPAGGMRSIGAESLSPLARARDLVWHLVLPASVLGLAFSGFLARYVRGSLLEALGQEHIRMARARGISERRILGVHALRYALSPVIQILGLTIPALLSGSLITEVVFSWPGLGRVGFEAVTGRDYPVILATTAFAATLVILFNLIADLTLAAVDPRVRDAQATRAAA
ncbi:MAG: ABC transporter permease [Acidobacteriota bacterium]